MGSATATRNGRQQYAGEGPGEFRLMVGTSSADLPLQASLTVVGPAGHIEARTRYLTEVTVR